MPDNLPRRLITTSENMLSSELMGLEDGVEIDDIARLWRVYHTIPSVHGDYLGYRLENLFWRIWGSECIRGSLRGSTVASLFIGISQTDASLASSERRQGQVVGDTTIATAHRNHLNKKNSPPPPLQGPHEECSLSSRKQSVQESQSKLHTQPPDPSPNETRKVAPLHPILKKPMDASQGDLHKTTRLLLTSPEGENVTRKPSFSPTPAGFSGGDHGTRQGKKKPSSYFVAGRAGTGHTKRRPTLVRRKSSQSSSTTGTAISLSQMPPVAPVSPLSPSGSRKPRNPLIQPGGKAGEPKAGLLPGPMIISPESPGGGSKGKMSAATRSAHKVLMAAEHRPVSPKETPPEQRPPITSGFAIDSVHRHGPARYPPSREEELKRQRPSQRQPSTASLVDKDFRSRFAERRLQEQRFATVSFGQSNLQTSMKSELASSVRRTGNNTGTDSGLSAAVTSSIPVRVSPDIGQHAPQTSVSSALPHTVTTPIHSEPSSHEIVDQSVHEKHYPFSPSGDLGSRLPSANPPTISITKPLSQLSQLIEQNRNRRPTSCSAESGESVTSALARDSAGQEGR